jgi:hypothetical protein
VAKKLSENVANFIYFGKSSINQSKLHARGNKTED